MSNEEKDREAASRFVSSEIMQDYMNLSEEASMEGCVNKGFISGISYGRATPDREMLEAFLAFTISAVYASRDDLPLDLAVPIDIEAFVSYWNTRNSPQVKDNP